MQDLTTEGRALVDDIARRHGFSSDAVYTLLRAVSAGFGTQAQFNHFEFGGMGQWSQGGMIMIGDMFNNGLKARVDQLCNELSNVLRNATPFTPPAASQSQFQGNSQSQFNGGQGVSLFVPGSMSQGNWWPGDLGSPSSSGAQNNMRYAVFPSTNRLAVDINGQISVYDTGPHYISGVSQQQSGDQSATFTSQFGLVRVADLVLVNPMPTNAVPFSPPPIAQPTFQQPAAAQAPMTAAPQFDAPSTAPAPAAWNAPPASTSKSPSQTVDEILAIIERLAGLLEKGILSDEEFDAKKSELLARI